MSVYYRSTDIVAWRTTAEMGWDQEVGILPTPIIVDISQRGNITHFPPAIRNPDLDWVYDCAEVRVGDDLPIGVLTVTLEFVQPDRSFTVFVYPIPITPSVIGTYISGLSLSHEALMNVVFTLPFADVDTELSKNNWIKWSNIGSLDFTIGKDNVAGTRPMDWKGWVYEIKKLGDKVVVYGENGVSVLSPSGTSYGLQTVHKAGLKGKQSIAGDDSIHFFIDTLGYLYIIKSGGGLEKLDYREYLSIMTKPVLSWDSLNDLLYICDGTYGYVYSPESKSLGQGPVNITGISFEGSSLHVATSEVKEIPLFNISTDIFDFGNRHNKSIKYIEIGTNTSEAIECSIDYRLDQEGAFYTTDWKLVNPSGMCYLPCFGVEFRFNVRIFAYRYFELDYLKVHGNIHGYVKSYPEELSLRN